VGGTLTVPANAVPKLTPTQKQFAALVASGLTPSQAAAQVGIAPRTGRKWASKPAVAEEIEKISNEVTRSVKLRLRALAQQAAAALEQVLIDAKAPAGAKVSAAKAVLDLLLRLDELEKLDEIEKRLSKLETAVCGGGLCGSDR